MACCPLIKNGCMEGGCQPPCAKNKHPQGAGAGQAPRDSLECAGRRHERLLAERREAGVAARLKEAEGVMGWLAGKPEKT